MRTYTGSTQHNNRIKKGPNKGQVMLNIRENERDMDEVRRLNDIDVAMERPPHIDTHRMQDNVYLRRCGSVENAYAELLSDSVERYNAEQKRNDRKTSVEKELQKVRDNDKMDVMGSFVIQVGNKDTHPDDMECKQILTEYYEKFKQKFSNLYIVSASIHMDESTPHLHINYIPFKTKERAVEMGSEKRWKGCDVQVGLTQALEQMGYTNDAKQTVIVNGVEKEIRDNKQNAMAQFEKDFNGLLDEICLEHDIVIDHYQRGQKVSHEDTVAYQNGELQKDINQLKTENALLKEKNDGLEKQKEALTKSNTALIKQNSELENEVSELKTKRDELEENYNNRAGQLHANYKKKKDALTKSLVEYQEETEQQKQTILTNAMSEIKEKKSELTALENDVRNLTTTKQELADANTKLVDEIAQNQSRLKRICDAIKNEFINTYNAIQSLLNRFFTSEMDRYVELIDRATPPINKAQDALRSINDANKKHEEPQFVVVQKLEQATLELKDIQQEYDGNSNGKNENDDNDENDSR